MQPSNNVMIYMYKKFVIHNDNLKFNPIEIKQTPEEDKNKQDTNNKDYNTRRKILKVSIKRKISPNSWKID